jgi:hypothetical protein
MTPSVRTGRLRLEATGADIEALGTERGHRTLCDHPQERQSRSCFEAASAAASLTIVHGACTHCINDQADVTDRRIERALRGRFVIGVPEQTREEPICAVIGPMPRGHDGGPF